MRPLDRFWDKVNKFGPLPKNRPDLGNCWLWLGSVSQKGYARFSFNKINTSAHRWIFAITMGEISKDRELDHLCRIRHCVRPSHLEIVTGLENIRRGTGMAPRNLAKTHCPSGHEYTPENTIYTFKGWRKCKACIYARNKYPRLIDGPACKCGCGNKCQIAGELFIRGHKKVWRCA